VSDLSRLVEDVERAYVFPTAAWGQRDVAVRKLLDAVKKHTCATTAEHDARVLAAVRAALPEHVIESIERVEDRVAVRHALVADEPIT
jgi:hypothetical protein